MAKKDVPNNHPVPVSPSHPTRQDHPLLTGCAVCLTSFPLPLSSLHLAVLSFCPQLFLSLPPPPPRVLCPMPMHPCTHHRPLPSLI